MPGSSVIARISAVAPSRSARSSAGDGRARSRFIAVLTSPTCVNACGKLPTMPAEPRVVLLGQQPDVVGEAGEPVEQRARLVVPADQARQSASQNVHGRNAPSPGGSPSSASRVS